MASSYCSSAQDLESLNSAVSNAVSLINQLQNFLESQQSPPSQAPPPPASDTATAITPEALSLASEAATLIRAHSSKISLFIITEPFTPTAITKVIRELSSSAISAFASAVEHCAADRYTQVVRRELAIRCKRVLRHLGELLGRVPTDGIALTADAGQGGQTSEICGAKGSSLANTGVLWSACDDVSELARLGVGGFLIKKTKEVGDTLQDVMKELKEWQEEGDDGDKNAQDDDDDYDDEHESTATTEPGSAVLGLTQNLASTTLSNPSDDDAQAMVDELMASTRHIPRDDPDHLRERLNLCLQRLRLTILLYKAAIKRRLETLPALPTAAPIPDPDAPAVPKRLDDIYTLSQQLSEGFTTLALAFYDLDRSAIDQSLDRCFFDAFALADLLKRPWNYAVQEDKFSSWAAKFQVEIKKDATGGTP